MAEQVVIEGATVRVHYTGRLADGDVFDSSAEDDPLEFTVGGGDIIEGFDRGVLGMKVGEKRTIEIAPEDGYGPHRDELVLQIPRQEMGPEIAPEVGMVLWMGTTEEDAVPVTVTEITDQEVTVDANPPLAGEHLTFDLELVAIL